jgi:hypothetical protein
MAEPAAGAPPPSAGASESVALTESLEVACSDADRLEKQLRGSVTKNTLSNALAARAVDDSQPDRHGRTPLMVAARDGDAACVAALVAAGADPRATDSFGRNALHHARINPKDDPDIAALLLVAGGSELAAQKGPGGKTPIDYMGFDSPRVGKLLDDALADPDTTLEKHRAELAAKQTAWKAQLEAQ